MFGINKKKKSESNEVYDGNWNFINPRWIIILLLLAEAGNYVLGISELNKQLHSFIGDIPQNVFFTVVCCVVVITLLIIFCVKKLPESTFFDHLRLSCLFIIIGYVVKLFDVLFVNPIVLSTMVM